MKAAMSKMPKAGRLRRLAALCAAAMLSGCAQGNSSADLAPAAPQAAAQAAAPSAAPPKAALTPEEAKAQCWMKYEGDKKVKNIDQRLTLVEKCVDDTLRGQLVQAPAR
jgi:ABC-type glycerol-3-phosphate transport system substrate-binding protein